MSDTAIDFLIAAAAVALGVAILLASRWAERTFPRTYRVINAVAWSIEGLFWAVAAIAVVYRLVTRAP